MRPYPALSSALLAGWVLATPPIDYDAVTAWTKAETWQKGVHVPEPVRSGSPRRLWDNHGAYDTAAECEAARAALLKSNTFPKKEGFPPPTKQVLEYARALGRQYAECVDSTVIGQ